MWNSNACNCHAVMILAVATALVCGLRLQYALYPICMSVSLFILFVHLIQK